jgi:hypothetical protein
MVSNILKTIFLSLGIACFVQFIFRRIDSDSVNMFLLSNLTNLQVALLAINAATLGIVLTKIRELIEQVGNKSTFESTKSEMLVSIKEQLALIIFSLIVIAFSAAKNPIFYLSQDVYKTLLLSSFIYSLFILYDTAKSVFVILDY